MLDKIMLIGNLGRDLEMSFAPAGQAVTRFSLAVSRRWNDKATGERKEETQGSTVSRGSGWQKRAPVPPQERKVYQEGRMTSRKYTDRSNVERVAWDCILSNMEMLDTKEARTEGTASDEFGDVTPDDVPF